VSEYDRQGYVIIPDALSVDLIVAARAEATAICRGLHGEINGVTPAPEHDDDSTVLRRYLCIHFPHKISSTMLDLARLPAVLDVLVEVIGPNVKMMQSMLFIKSEGKPGQAWHQDEAHIPTRDRSLTAVWIALDDATVENGCLWVIPGSHGSGVLHPVREQNDARSTARRRPTVSVIARRTRCRSSYPLARHSSLTATSCTDRCPIRDTTGCGERW
jgi:phytanoyl-CoA hydroxylase